MLSHPALKKLTMKIKIAAAILLICVSNVFGTLSYSQNTKVSLDLENTTLEQVMDEIEKQSEFYFIFNQKQVDVARKVNIQAESKSIDEVLADLFTGTDISYALFDRKILLTNDPDDKSLITGLSKNSQQQAAISGTIIDATTGDPMPGVNIQVKGTTLGVMSGADGKYTLNIPDRSVTLVFSFIGYVTQEIPVGTNNVLNVSLNTQELALDEVVVTALGIRREKKALSYAVSEVGGDDFVKSMALNVGNALTGRVAGVVSSGTAGGPAGSSRVIIRGNGSLSGDNQPLYVVNGMPITNVSQQYGAQGGGQMDRGDGLSSINPDDIESISILKGGTAAALYGSRAANGVILITTKSGQAQKGIGVLYSTSYTMENVADLLDWQYEYGSGGGGLAPATQASAIYYGRTSWGAKLDGSMVIQQDGVARPYSPVKDNVNSFYQTGSSFLNSVAISGGNDVANFRFSASNLDTKAVLNFNTFNRKTFSLDVNSTLAKKLTFEGNAQYILEDSENRVNMGDFTMNPDAGVQLIATNIDVDILKPGYNPDGTEFQWSDYNYAQNPWFVVNKFRNGDFKKRFIGSFKTRYSITDYLYASVGFGIDQINLDGWQRTPSGTAWAPRGAFYTDRSLREESNIDFSLGFNKDIGPFTVGLMFGGNQMRNWYSGINLSSGDLLIPDIYFIGNGTSQTFSTSFSELGINSLYGSADIDFNDFLYLTLSGRNDWFSTLDAKSNSLFYPSFGLSFLASEVWESKPAWINYAKVRTSWAQVGGGAPDPYAIYPTFTAQSMTHLGQSLMNVTSNTIPTLLSPYTSTTAEVGFEVRMLNNRLAVDLTLYDRRTTNDIVNAAITNSSGYTAVALNVGEMKNQGIELMLSGTPISSSDGLTWETDLNIAYNKNEVIKIAEGLTSLQLPRGSTRTENGWIYNFEGRPFGMVSGYRQLKDANGNLVFNSTSGIPVAGPLEAIGNGVPPLAVGLSNNLSYKNFNLNFLVDSRWGAYIYSATNAYGTDFGKHKMTVANGVRESGVAVTGVDQDGNPYSSTITAEKYFRGIAYLITEKFIQKADFIKLRSVSLGYNLPSELVSRTPFNSVNLSVIGSNLWRIYNTADNIDPEANLNNSSAQGLENFGLPPTYSIKFNLTVSF